MKTFFEYCTAAVAAGDKKMAEVLERLPAGRFEYAEAKNHLQAQRAPLWCKRVITKAHRNWLAAEEPAVESTAGAVVNQSEASAEDNPEEWSEARRRLVAVE